MGEGGNEGNEPSQGVPGGNKAGQSSRSLSHCSGEGGRVNDELFPHWAFSGKKTKSLERLSSVDGPVLRDGETVIWRVELAGWDSK